MRRSNAVVSADPNEPKKSLRSDRARLAERGGGAASMRAAAT
jgi:hypothetical protein